MTADRTQHYESLRYENQGVPRLLELIRPSEKLVLDVGSGTGGNLERLRMRGHDATGLTISEMEANLVRSRGFRCVCCDLEKESPPFVDGTFDVLVLSHVLEHLAWPETILRGLLRLVKPGGAVVVAVPNVLMLRNRLRFLLGRFRYEEEGVMDRGHLRFFDFEAVRLLLEQVGLTVVTHFGVGQVPLGPARRISRPLSTWIDETGSRLSPSLFAFHILARAEVPLPRGSHAPVAE